MSAKRTVAPVQGASRLNLPDGSIPWAVHALAAKEYNKHHSQSAERLADRGGFSWVELIAYLRGEHGPSGMERARKDLEAAAPPK